jgi:hypothetical protein
MGGGKGLSLLSEMSHGSAAPSPRTPHPGSDCATCSNEFCPGQVIKKGDISNDLRMGTFLMTLDTSWQTSCSFWLIAFNIVRLALRTNVR